MPASTANLGAGFDCLGIAVDRWLELRVRCVSQRDACAEIRRTGTLANVSVSPAFDLIAIGFRESCRAARRPVPDGLRFQVHSNIPVARGLGSSGSATVAGACAANALLALGLADETLVEIGARIEGHPDNVAPSVFGGVTFLEPAPRGGPRVVRLSLHPSLALAFAVPEFAVTTRRARAALPETIAHATAADGVARGIALVRGLERADSVSLAVGLDDRLHVPYRSCLVPGYTRVVTVARRAGAYGATLSGSGSTLVAVTPVRLADRVCRAMAWAWRSRGIAVETFKMTDPAPGYYAVRAPDDSVDCGLFGPRQGTPGTLPSKAAAHPPLARRKPCQ